MKVGSVRHELPSREEAQTSREWSARQLLVGFSVSDAEQILPVFILCVCVGQRLRGSFMHRAKVTHMTAVSAAKFFRRMFQQQDLRACFAGGNRRTKGGVTSSNHQDITELC